MTAKPITLDHLKSQKTRVTSSVRIATDEEVRERFEDIKQKRTLAKGRVERFPTDSEAQAAFKQISKEYAEAEREMAEHSIKFTFQAIGYRSYDQLVEKHTLSKEALDELVAAGKMSKQVAEIASWDPNTFPFALIAESMVEPEIEDKEALVEWLQGDNWNSQEIQVLFGAASEANMTTRVVELGNV